MMNRETSHDSGQKVKIVCYFGTYRAEYSRNKILIKGLIKNGVKVIECNVPLWMDIKDRINIVNKGWLKPSFWLRVIKAYTKLIQTYLNIGPYDVMIIGYPGQLDVFLGRLLTWLGKKKLVWDVFMSIYLISLERGLDKQNGFSTKLLKILEYCSLRLPDRLILDTTFYSQWIHDTYRISQSKIFLIPTGADDDVFYVPPMDKKNLSSDLLVLYYGTYIPNHGVPYIIESAKILNNKELSMQFILIGEGPELNRCQELAERYGLSNITFLPWMPQEHLINYISNSDIVLGAFGNTPQSLMTVQNKIYESMAMGRLVVSGESQAVRENFNDNEDIILCDRNNPNSLAEKLIEICKDRSVIGKIGKNANRKFYQYYSTDANGKRLMALLNEIIG